jgi:hypothetical protein
VLERYYNILGITSHASLNEVKKAFRVKAKQLHPDVNKSPDAHQQFILLLEAYDYVVNVRTGKIYGTNSTASRQDQTYRRWQDNAAERARHRAEYYARKKYDVFEESDYFKNMTRLNTVLDHVHIIFGLGMIIVLPIYLTTRYGWFGFFISLLANIITLPATIDSFKSSSVNPKDFIISVYNLAMTRTGLSILISILNVFLILRIGFQTMIPLKMLCLIYIVFILVSFFLFKFMRKESIQSSWFFALCYIPLMINIFFLANYIFSKNPKSESYAFVQKQGWSESDRQNLSYIELDNHAYAAYCGIRVLLDYKVIEASTKVTYSFEEGLFGIEVMKNYKFK